jgi:hypothetical protein
MDLLRRRHILGPTLSCPGLAAFDSGNPKRCGWSAGLEARAAGIALKRPASVASVGHLAPQHVSRVSLTGSRPGFDHVLAYDHVLGAVPTDRVPQLTYPSPEHDRSTIRLSCPLFWLVLLSEMSIFCEAAGSASEWASVRTTSSTKHWGRTSMPAVRGRRSRENCFVGRSRSRLSISRVVSTGSTGLRWHRRLRSRSRSGSVDPVRKTSTGRPDWPTASSFPWWGRSCHRSFYGCRNA